MAIPLALSVLLLATAMVLKATGAPRSLLSATVFAMGIASLWFSVAFGIWMFRTMRSSINGPDQASPEVPQFLWRLGATGRTSPEARKWAIVMTGSFMLVASLNSITGLPAWLRSFGVLIAATAALLAYWQLEKVHDQNADELSLQIRQRALRFTFSGQFVVWGGVHFLTQAGLLPDFRWSFLHLSILTVALYLVGTIVVSRRYL